MRQIAIFEAKTKLSELVSEAEAGHDVTITRRGRPVARLVPFESASSHPAPGDRRHEVAVIFAALKRNRKGVRLDADLQGVIADGRD